MKNRWKLPSLGTALLYTAALFQATQYARAFHQIDISSWWAQPGGVLAGIVVNVGLAHSAIRLPGIRGKRQQQFAYSAFGTLVVITPLFLAPINYKTMGDLWAEQPAVRWMLAILSASVVDIAIALVAFTGRAPASLAAKASDAGSDAQRKSATLERRSAKKSATLYRCECGFTSPDRFKMSGHMGKCAVHQQAKSGAPIPVDLSANKERSQ